MKITILTYGTRGDVQPFIGLATALEAQGHEVRFGAPTNFEGFVRGFGLDYRPLHGDSEEILRSPEGQAWLAAGHSLKFMDRLSELAYAMRHEMRASIIAACEGTELIIGSVLMEDAALILAEHMRVPTAIVYTMPLHAPHPAEVASIIMAPGGTPHPLLDRLSNVVFEQIYWRGARAAVQEWRAELGLAPVKGSLFARLRSPEILKIHAYSRLLVPRLKTFGPDDVFTGAFKLPETARARVPGAGVPEALSRWLDTGEAPVYVGLGSMPVTDPAAFLESLAAVTARLGVRAILGTGTNAYPAENLPAHLHMVGAVDHEWLFPRCRAAVHHGGAGTVHATLRAGLPTVVASVFADQPFWGHQLEKLGVGAHVPFKALTAATLEPALARVLTPEHAERARTLAEALQGDPGVEAALAALSPLLGAPPSPAAR